MDMRALISIIEKTDEKEQPALSSNSDVRLGG